MATLSRGGSSGTSEPTHDGASSSIGELASLHPPAASRFAKRNTAVVYVANAQLSMDLSKYSLSDWIYGVVTSLVAAVVLAVVVFVVRTIWRWIRSTSAESRRSDETERIIKVFVYRRYLERANVYSMTRGQFFVLTHFLRLFTAGFVGIAAGALVRWLTGMEIALYCFIGISIFLLVDALSWLDRRWSKRRIENPDEQALAAAAALLGERVDEVRSHVQGDSLDRK